MNKVPHSTRNTVLKAVVALILGMIIIIVGVIGYFAYSVGHTISHATDQINSKRAYRAQEFEKIQLPSDLVLTSKQPVGDLIDTARSEWGWQYTYTYDGDKLKTYTTLETVLKNNGYIVDGTDKPNTLKAQNTTNKVRIAVSMNQNLYIDVGGIDNE